MEQEIKVGKTVYEKLQEVRFKLSNANLKKSGHNSFQNYDYYQLDDFMPTATKLFKEEGLTPIFNIFVDEIGMEYAQLDIIDGLNKISFKCPTATPNGKDPIQQLGAKVTYMRRYMFLLALDITEPDAVDSQDNVKTAKEKVNYATNFQVEQIKKYGKLIAQELAEKGIKTTNQIKSLTLDEASKLMELINERLKDVKE